MKASSWFAAVSITLAASIGLADDKQPGSTTGTKKPEATMPKGDIDRTGTTHASQARRRPVIETPDHRAVLAEWGDRARAAAEATITRYGNPEEVTPSFLVWHVEGPWKRIVVHRDEYMHMFPWPHADVLEQVVDYKVPVDRFEELAKFDGSVVPSRTTGELSVRCGSEEMNLLALNLAIEVVTGKKSVEKARKEMATSGLDMLRAVKKGQADRMPVAATKLQFEVAYDDAATDPDKPMKISAQH